MMMTFNSLIRNKFQIHPFHIVEPSPWPLLTSMALLSFTFSGVLYFHTISNGGILFFLSFIVLFISIILWFRDVSIEGSYLGEHTFAVQKGLIIGISLFILSELIFFFGIFWAFFHSALAPTVELGNSWPPAGIETINPFAIPLLNTALLLSSGATITYSHHGLINGDRYSSILGALLTVILAVFFTSLQGFEYLQAPFTIADGVYGSLFYFSTLIHGIHVVVGTIFITIGLFRIINYQLTDHHHMGFESSILYWHFVDVVWLFLYITVYWWGS